MFCCYSFGRRFMARLKVSDCRGYLSFSRVFQFQYGSIKTPAEMRIFQGIPALKTHIFAVNLRLCKKHCTFVILFPLRLQLYHILHVFQQEIELNTRLALIGNAERKLPSGSFPALKSNLYVIADKIMYKLLSCNYTSSFPSLNMVR